ncbi:hypothetical protein, partial [Massilia sp.]|uniref:hypothetical protein n=1 Tax=Massilia sp. TaxID=1882437 RepID=UPI0039185C2C
TGMPRASSSSAIAAPRPLVCPVTMAFMLFSRFVDRARIIDRAAARPLLGQSDAAAGMQQFDSAAR